MTALFDAVFGVFVASMLVIAVLAVRWAVRRDRMARQRITGGPPSGEAPGHT